MKRKLLTFFDLRDMLALVGLGLLGVGVWEISESAAKIVVGAILITAGVVGHYRDPRQKGEHEPSSEGPGK